MASARTARTVGPAGGAETPTGVRTSVWTGGPSCVAAVLLLTAALPKLLSYDARTDEHAERLRAFRAADTDRTG
ncbi:hypothetical protein [Wenjunlia tyrosinilytica]